MSKAAFTRDEIVPLLRKAASRAAERAESEDDPTEAYFRRGEAWGFEKAARFVEAFLMDLP